MILRNVRHGDAERSGTIYAEAVDAFTKELEVAATLSYVLEAAESRHWQWVKES